MASIIANGPGKLSDKTGIDIGDGSKEDIESGTADLVGELTLAQGRGGEIHRGLKSRHIQFLYGKPQAQAQ
jgi:hypothetical protein